MTAPLRPQSAEQPRFQVNELIKDEAVWKGCRWEVSDKRSISWKAICRTKDDAQEVANALEAYARAAARVESGQATLKLSMPKSRPSTSPSS
jgi:hypothetical protein